MTDEVARRYRWGRALVALAWLVLLIVVLFFLADDLTLDQVTTYVADAGIAGALLFLAAFTLLQPVGLSAHILILASALIWDWWWALPLSLVGALCSSVSSYLVARYVAYDWVQARLPERLKRYEDRLVESGLWGVVIFRLLTFTTPPAQLMVGTLRIPFPTLLLGTAIGFVPTICIDIFLGGQLLTRLLG